MGVHIRKISTKIEEKNTKMKNSAENQNGKIIFYYGPMYSDKTYHLIIEAEKFKKNGSHIICLKPNLDVRDENGFSLSEIVSRRENKRIPAIRVKNSKDLKTQVLKDNFDAIFIDEAQFFDEGLKNVICELRDNGKTIICAGLDFYANRDSWATSNAIMKIADEKIPLHAECRCKINGKKCGKDAIYTFKFGGNLNQKVDVGDGDKYTAYCEECWDRETEKQRN